MKSWITRIVFAAVLLAVAGGFYLAMRERPILVDSAKVISAPMQVTIDEEGVTRVQEIYTVSSPIAGHLDRTTLQEGQQVRANVTNIASIHPLDSPFLDERTKAELIAIANAARSAIALAEVEYTQAQMAFELAQSEYGRASRLAKTNVISDSQLERSYGELQLKEAQVKSADALIKLREAELSSALARMKQPGDINASPTGTECCINLTSPVDGVVLKVLARSEQAVAAGAPIMEIGDPQNLEIVVDILSSDAPKIEIGSRVLISNWGGEASLEGRIRRIDPSAFTKVSSLGIEEQRVNCIIDITETPAELGHGYSILANIVIWSQDDVLQVPIGALFRSDGNWAVFAMKEGRAKLQSVRIGKMNTEFAQITDGITQGDTVILYPNDLLEDGRLVEAR